MADREVDELISVEYPGVVVQGYGLQYTTTPYTTSYLPKL